jgi:hypothetical protein
MSNQEIRMAKRILKEDYKILHLGMKTGKISFSK